MEYIGTKKIETKRLILRRFTLEDAPLMYERWASDPEVTKYLTWQAHDSPETTRSYLTYLTARYGSGDCFDWAVECKGVGVIGSIGVVAICEQREEAEVGYCFAKDYWGKGIATEALKAVLNYLFDQAHFRRIVAKHDTRNPASGRVMAKAGMKYEGILPRGGTNNRGIVDVVSYVMRPEDRE